MHNWNKCGPVEGKGGVRGLGVSFSKLVDVAVSGVQFETEKITNH